MPRLRLLLVFVPLCIAAQTPDTATVSGYVVDQTRGSVAGARITIANSLSGFERTADTDEAGRFSFPGVPVSGQYRVTAAKPSFADATLNGITLIGGTTADVTLQLNVTGGQTLVSVTGVVGEVRTDQPQLGDRLGALQMQETPLLNRKITFLPLLNAANRPALNQGDVFINQNLFTSNGAGRRQASFVVDGSTGNDAWGRQTIFSTIPLVAVQEMAILTNAFSAEFGGSTGSVINIVTRSGGSQFHGELLELWRPSATEAALSGFTSGNAANGNDLTSDTLGQSALSLSGPLDAAGRTHFFLAGEFSRGDKASPVTSPVAPGSFIGHYRGWLAFLRLDHQLNDRNNLFFRSDADAFHDTNPNGAVGGNNLPSVDRVFRRRTYSTELGETMVLSPTLLNNVRLQFQLGSPITQFDPVVYGTQYSVPISTGGTFTSGTSQSALLLNRQYQINDTLSVVRGRHQLKFGGDLVVAHSGGNSKEFGGPIYLGQFVYNTCTQSLAICEGAAYLNDIRNVRTYTQSYGNARYTVDDAIWALFAQDDFKLRPDLTLNLGLRYERQTITDASKNLAPRVGFAYNWRGAGRTVIRGAFGIYYSQIVDNSHANYALTGLNGVFNYTASAGQIGFPASIAAAPLPALPAGALVPVRSLYIRPDRLLNPYSEQWTFGMEHRLKPGWVLSVDYVGSHTLKINRPLDVNAPSPFVRTAPGQIRSPQAANCTRPSWMAWYSQRGLTCNTASATNPQPPFSVIQSDVNNGFVSYHALDVNLAHSFNRRLSMLASYTWSHAIDNVDPDVPGQNPNDANFTGKIEKGNAIFDQRQRFVLSGFYVGPWKVTGGGILTLGSGLPYNVTTGTTNSGDSGATADRPVINGVVVGRNTGRGNAVYDLSPFLERPFALRGDRVRIVLRAEAFNALNHANFVGYSGTYGNGSTPGPGFGQPLAGITNQLPARSIQFSMKVGF